MPTCLHIVNSAVCVCVCVHTPHSSSVIIQKSCTGDIIFHSKTSVVVCEQLLQRAVPSLPNLNVYIFRGKKNKLCSVDCKRLRLTMNAKQHMLTWFIKIKRFFETTHQGIGQKCSYGHHLYEVSKADEKGQQGSQKA